MGAEVYSTWGWIKRCLDSPDPLFVRSLKVGTKSQKSLEKAMLNTNFSLRLNFIFVLKFNFFSEPGFKDQIIIFLRCC